MIFLWILYFNKYKYPYVVWRYSLMYYYISFWKILKLQFCILTQNKLCLDIHECATICNTFQIIYVYFVSNWFLLKLIQLFVLDKKKAQKEVDQWSCVYLLHNFIKDEEEGKMWKICINILCTSTSQTWSQNWLNNK